MKISRASAEPVVHLRIVVAILKLFAQRGALQAIIDQSRVERGISEPVARGRRGAPIVVLEQIAQLGAGGGRAAVPDGINRQEDGAGWSRCLVGAANLAEVRHILGLVKDLVRSG